MTNEYPVYDNVTVSFNNGLIKDSEDEDKLRLKVYLRRKSDREWFQANVKLPKSFIKPIKGL